MNLDIIKEEVAKLESDSLLHIAQTHNLKNLEELRIKYLGKSGSINAKLMEIKSVPNELKKDYGAIYNALKAKLEEALEKRKNILAEIDLDNKLKSESIDITLPSREYRQGSIHPISQTIESLIEIFAKLGFTLEQGPEIDDENNNFTLLNIPEEHPARQMHDTFYLAKNFNQHKALLRTHTSTVQIRAMKNGKPPFRYVSIGRVFRCDSDKTHTPMFHQIEAVCIDKNINFAHLKYTLEHVIGQYFALDHVPLRFRPSYFPFTEPSAEVDVACSFGSTQVEIGKGTDFLEILGCGMVHPSVLKNVGIDPNEYQGFAFGMGIERITMLKYGMPDLRDFFQGDIRFLKHYNFNPFDIPRIISGI